mmetsp:Transcript_7389/g.22133  ORF Transcript_7389/g.22133 Transcript_7389/m.22133 type:complete len:211 (-) Transcript_7389:475-1107(-)
MKFSHVRGQMSQWSSRFRSPKVVTSLTYPLAPFFGFRSRRTVSSSVLVDTDIEVEVKLRLTVPVEQRPLASRRPSLAPGPLSAARVSAWAPPEEVSHVAVPAFLRTAISLVLSLARAPLFGAARPAGAEGFGVGLRSPAPPAILSRMPLASSLVTLTLPPSPPALPPGFSCPFRTLCRCSTALALTSFGFCTSITSCFPLKVFVSSRRST